MNVRSFLQWILVRMIALLAQTWRVRVDVHQRETIVQAHALVLFWHDEMLPVWQYFAPMFTGSSATALTSMSKDGDVLAELLRLWQYDVVRGSSSRGGSEALQEIIRATEQGMVLLTPDGPRGPRHVCKIGGIVAAHRTGKPLRLVRVKAKGLRLTNSWDHFLIPYPFARIDIIISDAMSIPTTASREEINRCGEEIQHHLQALGEA